MKRSKVFTMNSSNHSNIEKYLKVLSQGANIKS